MREQNEHIFNLLQKSLKEKPEDYLLKEGDVVDFYKKKGADISERTARDILKRLYPDLDPKTRKERFFARRIISKFILRDLGGTSLEDLLNPHNLELIEKELLKRNITLEIDTIQDLVKDEFLRTSAKWLANETTVQILAIQDKANDAINEMQKIQSQILFEEDKPKSFFKDRLADANFKINALDTKIKGLRTIHKMGGFHRWQEKIMEYKADKEIIRMESQINTEDKEFLTARLDEMKLTANEWYWHLQEFIGRTFIVKGGRGGGKSYETAKFLITCSLLERNVIFLCVRQTRNVINDSSLAVLKRIVSDFGLDRFFCVTPNTLKCTLTGSYFIFKGTMNPQNTLKSLENVKYAWVDEAQLVDQEFWTVFNPTIRRDDSLVILSMNPQTKEDPVYTTFIKDPKPTTHILHVNMSDNVYASDKLKEEEAWDREHRSGEDYRHIWLGEFLEHSDSLIFKGKFSVEFTPDPPAGTIFYYGADWGDRDPTVLVRCWVTEDWELVIDRCWWATNAKLDEIADGFASILNEDTTSERPLISADTNFPQTIRYLRDERDFNIRGVEKGKGSILDGIRRMKSFKKILVHKKFCEPVATEFQTYRYVVDKRTETITSVPEDANNHCMDGIRYALRRLRQDHPTTVRKNNDAVWQQALRRDN